MLDTNGMARCWGAEELGFVAFLAHSCIHAYVGRDAYKDIMVVQDSLITSSINATQISKLNLEACSMHCFVSALVQLMRKQVN